MKLWPLLAALVLSGCASKRLLQLEAQVLRQENAELVKTLEQVRSTAFDPSQFAREPDLDTVGRYLDRAGFNWGWGPDRGFIRMDFEGRETTFSVTIQHFEPADVLYIATRDYLSLDDAQSPETVVLLMVQLTTLNYDLLLGKFQLNPETGDVVLSSEMQIADGLGYEAFKATLEGVLTTADARYPELVQAAAGAGL
ncbi:MAG: YbjN domain-containing protein [Proteobacteria bacterium]|nr:YbjN domain-containing protein [Pseudomonadota bacterium]